MFDDFDMMRQIDEYSWYDYELEDWGFDEEIIPEEYEDYQRYRAFGRN